MTGEDLLRLQFALQRIGVDAAGDLVRLPGPHPDGLPRFYCARLADGGDVRFYRHDVPGDVRSRLARIPWEQARQDSARVCAILAAHGTCEGTWIGRSYAVTRPIDPPERAGVRRLDPTAPTERTLLADFDADMAGYGWPAFAILAEGRVVSACVSSREDDRAAEAWVQTVPAYRGRGFARRVTAAWAHAAQQSGKIPFYSHSEDNAASAGVARGLGLEPYAYDAGYL